TEQREKVKRQLDVKLPFLEFSKKHTMSALHGTGVGELFDTVHKVYAAAMIDMSTPTLTHILEDAVIAHQPPLVRGRRVKLKYAHQGGHNPPVIVIHGNQTKDVPASYKRYLENLYREKLGISGTPIRIEFRATENPFKDRRNKLTPRQVYKRKRLMRFVKKKK
ncbi:MAG: ribosome biogenesis GTPase Der, partial [Methylococcaceae bacterium]